MDASQPKDRAEFHAALAILLDRPGLSAGELDEHISALVRYADRRGLSLDACLVARDRGRMVSACLCIDSPGRVSSVFIPILERYLRPSDAIRGLLNESARLAGQRRVQMMQAMLSPDAALEAGVYRESGFDWLAELIYMDCDTSRPIRLPNGLPELRWVSYGSGTHELFSRVVEGTYVGSLDCVALSGVRAIEDILASHRAAGEFDPASWLVGLAGDEPVGVVLVGRIPERWAHEVVYMGVLPSWRDGGYGTVLLREALRRARDAGMTVLTLTVDARNVPAQRLYRRFGFWETSRRSVWMRLLPAMEFGSKV